MGGIGEEGMHANHQRRRSWNIFIMSENQEIKKNYFIMKFKNIFRDAEVEISIIQMKIDQWIEKNWIHHVNNCDGGTYL